MTYSPARPEGGTHATTVAALPEGDSRGGETRLSEMELTIPLGQLRVEVTLALPYVQAPTLLIVPGTDIPLAGLSRDAITHLRAIHSLELIPNATQIFDQPDALEEAMRMSSSWFRAYLRSAHATAPPAA